MIPLTLLPGRTDATRIGRDRLELLTALINAPAFDPLFRDTLIRIPPQHPVYAWRCTIDGCGRPRQMGHILCESHHRLWTQVQASGMTRADFLRTAEPLPAARGTDHGPCRICPERPATTAALRLCGQHYARWLHHAKTVRAEEKALQPWLRTQAPLAGYGICQAVCPFLAASSLGLCRQHEGRYQGQARPGGAAVATTAHGRGRHGRRLPVTYQDEDTFRAWCAQVLPVTQPGLINLHGLPPLLAAEIRWGLRSRCLIELGVGL